MGLLKSCIPRPEILMGDLSDALFGAEFGDLLSGTAADLYCDPVQFFANTHPAAQLCKVVQLIFARLADTSENGGTVRLSTGFGGGKSHTLMVLYHLANNIDQLDLGTEILPAAGRPKSVKLVAVDCKQAGKPVFARHGDLEIKSLWGEIAYQLGGEVAWKALGAADDAEAQPDEALLRQIFPAEPVLILIDELVVYMSTLSNQGQNNLLAFLSKLAAIAATRPATLLVVTDPADQRSYALQSAAVGQQLKEVQAAIALDEVLSRKAADYDPIGNESTSVILRRLFQKIDPNAAQACSAAYYNLYKRLREDSPDLILAEVASPAYAQRILHSYPFHPRLLDTVEGKLGAMSDFQKSRGILRLFARIVRDIWEQGQDLDLIGAGEINWASGSIQGDLIQRLNRDRFRAAITADIEQHATQLDGQGQGIHRRVASALLLESLPLMPNSGMNESDITLAVLRLDEAGPEAREALERLIAIGWHTYPMAGGRGWRFLYEPNVNRLIEERAGEIDLEDARRLVLNEVRSYFTGPSFKPAHWPQSPADINESAELTLALCENEELATNVCCYMDNTLTIPRRFINSLVAVAPSKSVLDDAILRARRLMAAEQIEKENQEGEQGKMVREQLKRLMPDLKKQFRISAPRAFNRLVLVSGSDPGSGGLKAVSYELVEKYLVPDNEENLNKVKGQGRILEFLVDESLIFESGDSLDVDLFMDKILPGTTPRADKAGVYTARAVHERFLSLGGLRLLPDSEVVRETIKRAIKDGRIVLYNTVDGQAYDKDGIVSGPPGMRKRTPGSLDLFSLTDEIEIADRTSEIAQEWTQEDPGVEEGKPDPPYPPPTPPPPPRPPVPNGPVQVDGWEAIGAMLGQRPLEQLQFSTGLPLAASRLLAIAQPLGATSVSLSINLGGDAKDSGHINFKISEVKPTHPLKPLSLAGTLYNALEPDSVEYEVTLSLSFQQALSPAALSALQQLVSVGTPDIEPRATFGPPQ